MSKNNAIVAVRYGIVLPAIGAATAASLLLDPVLGPEAPFLLLLPTAILVAWYGGFGPGLLATVTAALCATYFLIAPRYSWAIQNPAEQAEVMVFVAVGTIVSVLSEILRRAQRRLHEYAHEMTRQREQFRVTLASIGDAVIATDSRGRIAFLNDAAERLTGWTNAEAADQPFEDVFNAIDEHSRQRIPNPIARVLYTGKALALENHTLLIARDGSRLPIDESAAPIRDALAAPVGVVIVFRDITERRKLEQQLEQRVDDLGAADRRKNEFLGMLAHELRNPLATIRNAVDLLGHTPQPTTRCRGMIERQVTQMTHLIDDLLDVTRIGLGKLKLAKQSVELTGVVAGAVEVTRPLIDSRRQTLTVSLPSRPVRIDADASRLTQVLVNLLINAAKYTNEEGHIRLSVEHAGLEAVVRIRDDGIGIAAELLPRVFDLYAQADNALSRSQGGLGIGLTLVRNLVEMHQGRIQALSDGPGRGSEFIIQLPALAEPQKVP